MEEVPKNALQLVETMAEGGKYAAAIARLDELGRCYPADPRVSATRAYVMGHQGDHQAAVECWSRAIALLDEEPHYFYMRGIHLFALGRFRQAVVDFTEVVRLCDHHGSDYYRAPAHFFKADALLQLGELRMAEAECAQIPEDMQVWTDRLRTRANILADCRRTE